LQDVLNDENKWSKLIYIIILVVHTISISISTISTVSISKSLVLVHTTNSILN